MDLATWRFLCLLALGFAPKRLKPLWLSGWFLLGWMPWEGGAWWALILGQSWIIALNHIHGLGTRLRAAVSLAWLAWMFVPWWSPSVLSGLREPPSVVVEVWGWWPGAWIWESQGGAEMTPLFYDLWGSAGPLPSGAHSNVLWGGPPLPLALLWLLIAFLYWRDHRAPARPSS